METIKKSIKKAVIIFAQKNFNDNEFLITFKKLNRAGVNIFKCSENSELAIGQYGYKLKPEIIIENLHIANFDAIILIGGKGVYSLLENNLLKLKLQQAFKLKKIIASICGATRILANSDILKNVKVTGFPADKENIISNHGIYTGNDLEIDNVFITAKDETCSEIFAESILNKLNGK